MYWFTEQDLLRLVSNTQHSPTCIKLLYLTSGQRLGNCPRFTMKLQYSENFVNFRCVDACHFILKHVVMNVLVIKSNSNATWQGSGQVNECLALCVL